MVDSVKGRLAPAAPPPSKGGAVSDPLDARLLDEALRQLSEQPVERLSLRRVAAGLDVSHQAPYVHFASKREFLAAVAGTGLQRAADEAASAVAAAGSDPRERLHALAEAYLSFIRTRPHVHDLANGPLVAKADHPLLQQAAIAYWNVLHDVVAGCQPHGADEAEVLQRCAVAWGTVYGLARLGALDQFPDSVPAEPGELLHEALDTLYEGWQSHPAGRADLLPAEDPPHAGAQPAATTTSSPTRNVR